MSKNYRTDVNLFQFRTINYILLLKVFPPESNVLSHPFLPYFYILLKGFFWNTLKPRLYGPLDGLHAFKADPLDDPLDLVGKKSHGTRSGEWEVVSVQELSDSQSSVSWCIVVVKQPRFVLQKYHLFSRVKATRSRRISFSTR